VASGIRCEQTEIDALATLRPDALREIVDRAFDPYCDRTLEARVGEAEEEWLTAAQAEMSEQVDDALLSTLREQAAEKLSELREEIDRINSQLHLAAADHVTLPEIEVPEPELDDDTPRQALVSIDQDWVDATRALIAHKAYGGDPS
jgi:hypothetical protein